MKASRLLLHAGVALGSTLVPRQNAGNTATVDLSVTRGRPAHLASGILYGIPDAANQIPDHFYTDIGFNYARIGGGQLKPGGWEQGAYPVRFNSAKINYHTARKFGAKVVLLPSDIWGTDYATGSTHWPGDNGDWTDYDKFLDRLISDVKSNNMLDGLVWDIWNEPDYQSGGKGIFWQRSQSQWLDLYVRTHKRIRADPALNGVLISGPTLAFQPASNNNWWTGWLQRVVKERTIPDQYVWHDEPGDIAKDSQNFNALLKQYGAPSKQVNINEYATFGQQNSAGAAWWISRLERYDYIGMRGNWLSGCQLHDFMASLLGKSDTKSCAGGGYYGNGEFQVYKYYNTKMTGTRVRTTSSGDGTLDVYSTIGSDGVVRILTGVLGKTGTWFIKIAGLSRVGLPVSGKLVVQTWGFDDKGHFGRVDGPSDRGKATHDYQGDSVIFPVVQTEADKFTAWGFEFARGR